MAEIMRRTGRILLLALYTVLALSVLFIALAVLVQTLAVFLIGIVTASLLLPHPFSWYIHQGTDTLKKMLKELIPPQQNSSGTE